MKLQKIIKEQRQSIEGIISTINHIVDTEKKNIPEGEYRVALQGKFNEILSKVNSGDMIDAIVSLFYVGKLLGKAEMEIINRRNEK